MSDTKNHSLHIGMRKIKSLLAILIGFLIWQAVRLVFPDLEVHPIFIYIYGFIEIRDTSEKTKTLGIQRIKATVIAIGVGLPMLFLRVFVLSHFVSATVVMLLDLVLLFAGTLIALQFAEKADCGNMTGMAAVYFIILLISHADDSRYLYAVLRASQTVIGVFVAWLVNVILFPYPGKKMKDKEQG